VEGAVGRPLPQNQTLRLRNISALPMMPKVLPPAMLISADLRPVPAKIGSREPEWPIIALGVGAAAVGAVAIYYALRKKE
jgi:hypothetical protein